MNKMPRILSLLILLATVGTLAADPIKKCVGDNEDLNRFVRKKH